MKRVLGFAFLAVASAAFLAVGGQAHAALMMRVTASGAPVETITDGDGDDLSAGVDGIIIWSGSGLGDFLINVDTAANTTVTFPQIHLTVTSRADAADLPSSLKVEIVQDFGPVSIGADVDGFGMTVTNLDETAVSVKGYLDASGGAPAFSTGSLTISSGPVPGPLGTFAGFKPHGDLTSLNLGLTANIVFTSTTGGSFQADLDVSDPSPEGGPLVPEPASLAVWGGLSVLGLVFGRRFAKKAA